MDDYNKSNIILKHGDCLERAKEIESGSVDLVLIGFPDKYRRGVQRSISNSYKAKLIKIANRILKKDGKIITYQDVKKDDLCLEDLIKTFSKEEDTVVDLTMGSGGTMVACLETDRKGIGIEGEESYFKLAIHRCEEMRSTIMSGYNQFAPRKKLFK